ncbi:MAG: hypothetical protein WBC93_04330 [Sulfitobacter sp.]
MRFRNLASKGSGLHRPLRHLVECGGKLSCFGPLTALAITARAIGSGNAIVRNAREETNSKAHFA